MFTNGLVQDEIIKAQRELAQREADPFYHVKQQLEEKLKFGPENLPGIPGLVPPTRKMVDELQGRECPVSASSLSENQQAQQTADPLPAGMEFTDCTFFISLVVAAFVLMTFTIWFDLHSHVLVDTATTSDPKIRLKASPELLDIGHPITVEWETEDEPTTSDWIGLYAVGNDNQSYITWNWIRSSKKGSITFTPTQFGNLEFRYFASTSSFFSRQYSIKAVSNPVQIKCVPFFCSHPGSSLTEVSSPTPDRR